MIKLNERDFVLWQIEKKMRKCKLTMTCIALCIATIFFASCSLLFPNGFEFPSLGGGGGGQSGGSKHPSVQGVADRLTKDSEKIAVFNNDLGIFNAANGYANQLPFNCFWSAGNARIEANRLLMSLTEGFNNYWGRELNYVGAECRTSTTYSYGFYSVSMKAAKCSGVISSFFTYTNNGGWDEIDVEFLGKDTTHIQLNYYTKGVGGHEFWYDLGFDGADDFHEYAFEWLPNSITWYVDGKAVYRATENIPNLPQQIMMNVWNCVGADEWSGKFTGSPLPATAEYQWVGFSAA